MDNQNIGRYYKLFNLHAAATVLDVRDAYRRLAKQWHPDKFAQDNSLRAEATEKMKEINIARDAIVEFLKLKPGSIHSDHLQDVDVSHNKNYRPNVDEKEFRIHVSRNLKGIKLEKLGLIDKAIELYIENVNANFEGNHPYDRLAIIYRKRRQYDREIAVLEKAIWVFENIVFQERSDRVHKLEKFRTRLNVAIRLRRDIPKTATKVENDGQTRMGHENWG